MKTDTPESDAFIAGNGYHPTEHMWRDYARKLERERDEARVQVERWKHHFITFAVIHMAQYGKDHFGTGYLYPTHYDLLKEAGARMDDFKRAESNPPIMP